jgi:phage-related protein
VWATTVFVEVVELGFDRSYPAFTRPAGGVRQAVPCCLIERRSAGVALGCSSPTRIASMLCIWGTVELEPEVREWLERLPTVQFVTAAFYIDLLADTGLLLDEPYTKHLDGKLRELRFHLDRMTMRLTYWIASGRRIILLTVFTKTRMREDREVARAKRALARCQAELHTVEDDDE